MTIQSLPYLPLHTVLAEENYELPQILDPIIFSHRGILFTVYGLLHGATGGTNAEYRQLIQRTIDAAPGLKLAEKELRRLYTGLELEMDDYRQIPFVDAFKMMFSIMHSPIRLFAMAQMSYRERVTKADRFGQCGVKRLQDIGGSPAFHRLSPSARRRYAGFPIPRDYLLINLGRRMVGRKFASPNFPDQDWKWLGWVEPYINIPCRSIHMMEFAAELAKIKGVNEVTLFVGEIHNSDMSWIAGGGLAELPEWARIETDKITAGAQVDARKKSLSGLIKYKAAGLLAVFAGLSVQVSTGYLIFALTKVLVR